MSSERHSTKAMNFPNDVLCLIFSRCDNETLSKVSLIPTLSEQLFSVVDDRLWFMRVELLCPFQPDFDLSCWKTTWYSIRQYTSYIRDMSLGCLPRMAVTCFTLNAAKILSSMDYRLHLCNNRPLRLACQNNDVPLVSFLLENEKVRLTDLMQTTDCLYLSVTAGSYDVVRFLLSSNHVCNVDRALDQAFALDHSHIVRLMMEESDEVRAKVQRADLSTLSVCVNSGSVKCIGLLLELKAR